MQRIEHRKELRRASRAAVRREIEQHDRQFAILVCGLTQLHQLQHILHQQNRFLNLQLLEHKQHAHVFSFQKHQLV